MDWWKASPDGRYIVYGLSKDGSEDSTLHVLSVADGRVLPESIPDTQSAVPQWLDDASGFFYNQLTGAVDTPERFLDSRARFHRLGTNPADDPILMHRGLVRGIDFEPIQMPYIVTYPGSRYVLLALTDVRPESRLYVAPLADVLADRARWAKVAEFDDEVTSAELDGEDLYLIANKGAPRGRIVKTRGIGAEPRDAPPKWCRKVRPSSRTCPARATASTCASWMAASIGCAGSIGAVP